jgi:hypothetical protein
MRRNFTLKQLRELNSERRNELTEKFKKRMLQRKGFGIDELKEMLYKMTGTKLERFVSFRTDDTPFFRETASEFRKRILGEIAIEMMRTPSLLMTTEEAVAANKLNLVKMLRKKQTQRRKRSENYVVISTGTNKCLIVSKNPNLALNKIRVARNIYRFSKKNLPVYLVPQFAKNTLFELTNVSKTLRKIVATVKGGRTIDSLEMKLNDASLGEYFKELLKYFPKVDPTPLCVLKFSKNVPRGVYKITTLTRSVTFVGKNVLRIGLSSSSINETSRQFSEATQGINLLTPKSAALAALSQSARAGPAVNMLSEQDQLDLNLQPQNNVFKIKMFKEQGADRVYTYAVVTEKNKYNYKRTNVLYGDELKEGLFEKVEENDISLFILKPDFIEQNEGLGVFNMTTSPATLVAIRN